MKKDIPKLFGQVLTMSVKEKLIQNMTKYQIAAKPGHMATEHIFVIMSLMAFFERSNKAFIITMFDLRKYFDRESIFDCMYELHKSQIRGKKYRLMFRMNESIKIRVETPVGLSDEEDIQDQGLGKGQ